MNEWVESTLGDVADVIGGGTPSTKEPTYWGGEIPWLTPGDLTKREGRVITTTERTISAAGMTSSSAKLLPKDAVLLTSRATVGAVGLAGQPMATNQGFQSLVAREGLLPRFLMCWVQANREEFQKRASGSTFPEISGKKVRTIPIRVPPLHEQRRIVAVMSAVDSQIEVLQSATLRCKRLLAQYLKSEFASTDGRETPIVDLCIRVIGGIWGSSAGESEVDVLALGPRVYSLGTTSLLTTGSPIRSFTAKQIQDRLVQQGDIILERSGGSPTQPVGRVVIAGDGLSPSVPTDFQRLLRPDPSKVDARYLLWRLQADWNAGEPVKYSGRTTGITNLSVKDYIARKIAIPTLDAQRRVVAIADGLQFACQMVAAELASLRVVRSALLSALLSQSITVGPAVDEFVKAA